MTVLEELAGRAEQLTAAEAEVARFLHEHPHRFGHLSASRIAEEVGVSDATVIRTARRLGFDRLDDLREALAEELSARGRLARTLSATQRAPVRELLDQRAGFVAALEQRLTDDDLTTAVAALAAAHRVVVVAFGPSAHIAEYASAQFRRSGAASIAITRAGRDFADGLALLARGDAVILLAYDDVSVEGDALLDHAGSLDVPVVLVTEDPLVGDRRPLVVLASGRGEPRTAASQVPTVAVLEALALAVAARHRRRAEQASSQLAELRHRIDAGHGRSGQDRRVL